jgi:hypothetical protein
MAALAPHDPRDCIIDHEGRPLYDPRSGRFDPGHLTLALVAREMSPEQLARAAGCSRSSVYKALAGIGVSRRIATAILGALARHPRTLPAHV